jgi:hypothetical protein
MQALSNEINVNGADKIARYGWTVRDSQGNFRVINKRLLHVNREIYQREGMLQVINSGLQNKFSMAAEAAQ